MYYNNITDAKFKCQSILIVGTNNKLKILIIKYKPRKMFIHNNTV